LRYSLHAHCLSKCIPRITTASADQTTELLAHSLGYLMGKGKQVFKGDLKNERQNTATVSRACISV
jgi:hypothetical protein